jgi:hypothetical protein
VSLCTKVAKQGIPTVGEPLQAQRAIQDRDGFKVDRGSACVEDGVVLGRACIVVVAVVVVVGCSGRPVVRRGLRLQAIGTGGPKESRSSKDGTNILVFNGSNVAARLERGRAIE